MLSEKSVDTLLLCSTCGRSGGNLRDRCEDKLASEVVGIWRVEDGGDEVDQLCIRHLRVISALVYSTSLANTHWLGLFLIDKTAFDKHVAILANNPCRSKR